eukprot:COSAG01_NODE_21343_length_906_cov_1.102850_1_plen_290_part_01
MQFRPSSSVHPGARHAASTWDDAEGHLWLFGGNGYAETAALGELNDLWYHDGSAWTWVGGTPSIVDGYSESWSVQGVGSEHNWIGSRSHAAAWRDSSGIPWVFGGLGFALFAPKTQLSSIWTFLAMCVSGLTPQNSSTVCVGSIGDRCPIVCDDGHSARGLHTCRANRSFTGGSCVPSVCPAVRPSTGQAVISGCSADGVMNEDHCELGCADGYVASGVARGVCRPDTGAATASYQGMTLACVASTCAAPTFPSPLMAGQGCVTGSLLHSKCEPACERGFVKSAGRRGIC